MTDFDVRAGEACEAMLGEPVERVEYPAGRSRRSVRVQLAGRTVIATQRRNAARAVHEVRVLRALAENGAPVPAILAWRDGWLVQEDLGERRLGIALDGASPESVEAGLGAALDALARCHAAADAAGLAAGRPQLGGTAEWRATFAATPRRAGEGVGLPPPPLDEAAIAELVQPRHTAFVKWDARPGNAVLRADGSVAWFDWEHAGVRAPLDDVAWLLADEYVADAPEIEAALLAHHLADFAGGGDAADARRYLAAFGVLHSCVRLALIVSYRRRDGRWWDRDRALRADRVGVTPDCVTALCARGARWSAEVAPMRPLAAWFGELADRILADATGPAAPE